MVNLAADVKDGFRKTTSLCGLYDWRHRGRVTIITYHRVLPLAQLKDFSSRSPLIASVEAFERNMQSLRKRYQLIAFDEYLQRIAAGDWSPKVRYAIVTLDDGWIDNYVHAFPVLKRYAVPATVFVATGFIGTRRGFWWQLVEDTLVSAYHHARRRRLVHEAVAEHGLQETSGLQDFFMASNPAQALRRIDGIIQRLKTYPPARLQRFAEDLSSVAGIEAPMALSWHQIAEMSSHGITFGAHSVNHHILTAISAEDAAREIIDSATILQANPAVNYAPIFAYPNGDTSDRVCDLVRAAGYRAAVTTEPKVTGFRPHDLYRLPRINIGAHIAASKLLFKSKLSRARSERSGSLESCDPVHA